jgi:DNA repair protein RecO (recombination protein O)
MALLVTDAVVLHAFNYLESSRILRLATREGGVRSVLARGLRRSGRRFSSAVDLFAQGAAQLHVKPGRELDTLGGFDVTRARPLLATDLQRFTGAAVIAELALRFTRDEHDPPLFDAIVAALDRVESAPGHAAREATLGGAWRIIAELGFAPNVDVCGACHTPLDPDAPVRFSHPAGGALCDGCARLAVSGRTLPPKARAALRAWIAAESAAVLDDAAVRAHQRLLREFLHEHLLDGQPLPAFDVWERNAWSAA